MRVRILETETTKQDAILKNLIGTIWTVDTIHADYVTIDCCGGLELEPEEYEIVQNTTSTTETELLNFTDEIRDFANDVWRFVDAGELTSDILLEFTNKFADTIQKRTFHDLIEYINRLEKKARRNK
ncbi:hypothetical protein 015DV002_12 [Bacillus phage 015DV002]|nr:hypothetical protein 015DV002_12 [Bacillus phage 015DV002]